MPPREEYEELARFRGIRDWAEEGSFGPLVTALAVMGVTVASIQPHLAQAQPMLQALASQIPTSLRMRCYEDPRWVFQGYLRGMAAAGLPGLAGFTLIVANVMMPISGT